MNSLGFDKAPNETRVVVAMSGGVDSSTVAAMLHAQNYDVIGITLQLYDHGAAIDRKGACCAGQDITDARRVADMLGIPHYILNYEDKFKNSVMDDFVNTYLAGATPIPCVRCNQTVKFQDLLATAHDLDADCMATGHYVQRIIGPDGTAQLHRGVDTTKDQSYFLFATTQEQLDFLRFPLGGMDKTHTRMLAEEYGLAIADKPDSQDICFVPNGDYAAVIKKMRPSAQQPGDIIHIDGTIIGKHDGIIHYTVGQRRGLNIGGTQDPLYVIKLDATHNRVIVGPKEVLNIQRFPINTLNWLDNDGILPNKSNDIMVKMRSQMQPVPAHIERRDSQAEVVLHTPHTGIAPGQACVAYADDRVLGGGWISAPAT